MPAKILAFAGSVRKESFNVRLLHIAVAGAKAAGADVTLADLRDFPLPLFDQDLEAEQGLPEPGKKLRELFLQNDALLIASPEYNSSITPLMKNTIDWLSRPYNGEPALKAFTGKTAALCAASPSWMGGMRSLVTLKMLLGNIGVVVLPQQMTVPSAMNAFDGSKLVDDKQQTAAQNLGKTLAEYMAVRTAGG